MRCGKKRGNALSSADDATSHFVRFRGFICINKSFRHKENIRETQTVISRRVVARSGVCVMRNVHLKFCRLSACSTGVPLPCHARPVWRAQASSLKMSVTLVRLNGSMDSIHLRENSSGGQYQVPLRNWMPLADRRLRYDTSKHPRLSPEFSIRRGKRQMLERGGWVSFYFSLPFTFSLCPIMDLTRT